MSSRAAESVTAVVAAAGSGERLGAGGPKAFVPLRGRPLVEWSIAAFRATGVDSIVVACPPGHAHGLSGENLVVVEGGATRAASVANALEAVGTELVAIHDAARPLVTPELIEGVVDALAADSNADGAIAAVPLVDTVKQVAAAEAKTGGSGKRLMSYPHPGVVNSSVVVETTLDRKQLWAAQTPQVFRAGALRRALDTYPGDAPSATDEAMLVEAAGGRVLIHPASPENLKVTTPLDRHVAEALLAERAGGAG